MGISNSKNSNQLSGIPIIPPSYKQVLNENTTEPISADEILTIK